jgi:hypothetical protein
VFEREVLIRQSNMTIANVTDSILYLETPWRLVNFALCLSLLRTRSNH